MDIDMDMVIAAITWYPQSKRQRERERETALDVERQKSRYLTPRRLRWWRDEQIRSKSCFLFDLIFVFCCCCYCSLFTIVMSTGLHFEESNVNSRTSSPKRSMNWIQYRSHHRQYFETRIRFHSAFPNRYSIFASVKLHTESVILPQRRVQNGAVCVRFDEEAELGSWQSFGSSIRWKVRWPHLFW